MEPVTLYAGFSLVSSLVGAGLGYLFVSKSFTGVAAGIFAVKTLEILFAAQIVGLLAV